MPSATRPSSTTAKLPANWSRLTWALLLAALSLATLLLHGFHPFAEDGGLYAAEIEYRLDRSLFPHFTPFVTVHLRFSLFAPAMALLVRLTRLSLAAVLLALDIAAAFFTLTCARALLRRCFPDHHAQLAGLALLAAGWTLPIAGTSLYLMDPYVTARSLSLPLSLLAAAFALDAWERSSSAPAHGFVRHPALRCAVTLLLTAAFHPLMAVYAFLLVGALRATRFSRPTLAWLGLTSALLLACLALNALAPPESLAKQAAVITRYYWFLSQWHWYECLGLLGPLAVLWLIQRFPPPPAGGRTVSMPPLQPLRVVGQSAIGLALLCTTLALLFAHESSSNHAVARLQPLREFLLVYAVMLLLLGATIYTACARLARRASHPFARVCLHALPACVSASMAIGLFLAERATYPSSPHVEFPWEAASTQNGWVRAFLWARTNTPRSALFALDARYVNTAGEDAQTFRAISLRSALPDYSKDGGEASITPALASAWLAAATAQKDLSDLSDTERDRRLRPFGVTWMVLHTGARTEHTCPYRNETVQICVLP